MDHLSEFYPEPGHGIVMDRHTLNPDIRSKENFPLKISREKVLVRLAKVRRPSEMSVSAEVYG